MVNVCKTTDGRTDDATITTRFRVEKTSRLRAAVEEAKAEIAAYRAEREGRYARLVQEVRARLARRLARNIGLVNRS